MLQNYQLDNPTISLKQELAPLPPIPAKLEATIFRIIQEALNNIRKHAQATRILLRIELQPGSLQLEIHDNGRGFDPQHIPNESHTQHAQRMQSDIIHSGLRGMRSVCRKSLVPGSW